MKPFVMQRISNRLAFLRKFLSSMSGIMKAIMAEVSNISNFGIKYIAPYMNPEVSYVGT